MDDVILNKKVSIDRCIAQIEFYYTAKGAIPFAEDYLRQDAICMNLQRACEQTIDIANHIIRSRKLGVPQNSGDAFTLLHGAGLIDENRTKALHAMTGFRNILVHQYQRIALTVLVEVIEHRLYELRDFAHWAVEQGASFNA